MLTFAFIENLPAVYAERFLSGMFAAAVTPVLGPMLGVFVARGEPPCSLSSMRPDHRLFRWPGP
jgi:hypothetical protein